MGYDYNRAARGSAAYKGTMAVLVVAILVVTSINLSTTAEIGKHLAKRGGA